MIYKTLHDTYFKHVLPLSIALSAAQHHGAMVDKAAIASIIASTQLSLVDTNKAISAIAGSNVNCNSPKQMKELLYDKLKFPTVYEKDKISTSENAILKLRKMYPNDEILSLILKFRKDSKLVSTLTAIKTDENSRVHTSYNTSGTKNGRISSSKDLFGEGMNLQNVPAGRKPGVANVRHIFIAPPGCSLVKGDLSQAETMVVARILCRYGDFTLYNKYKENPNFDIHKWAASTVYEKPEDQITKSERDVGKIANHAGNYCSGPQVIVNLALKWDMDSMTLELAKRISATRHKYLPGLKLWWADVERTISRTRVLTTCMGRKRIFFGRTEDNVVIRDAVAFEPQSTVGDVCNQIFREMYEDRDTYKGMPILQVHDEVVSEVPDEYIPIYVLTLKQKANIPLHLNNNMEPLVIPIDVKVGKNWRDTKVIE